MIAGSVQYPEKNKIGTENLPKQEQKQHYCDCTEESYYKTVFNVELNLKIRCNQTLLKQTKENCSLQFLTVQFSSVR